MPAKPGLEGLEAKWIAEWDAQATYRFDRSAARERIFSIDTPPPTVSGSLHVGHVFSFTHTDIIARFQRMSGRAVFYPMGWDDNGLPTERRVQNYLGVRCDPSLPYDPDAVGKIRSARAEMPATSKPSSASAIVSVSRPSFIELCGDLTREDEKAFEHLWRTLGLSVDWALTYATIGRPAQRVSQLAFLRLLAKPLPSPFTRATRSKRRRSGMLTSRPRSRRRSSKIARCRGPTTASASRPTWAGSSRSTRPGRSSSRLASRSLPTRTTPGTSRSSAAPCSRPSSGRPSR